MLIPVVEEGLEKILRDSLPLPADIGDISFDAPASTWSAQLSRLTVNVFLYEVGRSSQPAQPPARRPNGAGGVERRVPLPMIELSYLISAWAGSPRDEHQLLSDVLYTFLTTPILSPADVDGRLASNVQLALAVDDRNRPRELWSSLGSTPKAAFCLTATVAADAFLWTEAAPGVTSVTGVAGAHRPPPPADPRGGLPPVRTRRENGRVVMTPADEGTAQAAAQDGEE